MSWVLRAAGDIAISGDTRPCLALEHAAAGADLLIDDATFASGEEGRARETGTVPPRKRPGWPRAPECAS